MVIKGEHARRIDRLISQSYDSDPKVRMKVVSELSAITDHPGAVFALLELASDKDEGIKNAAQSALSKVKQRDDVGSLQKLFQQSETEHIETGTQVRERLMPSIDRLFTNKKTKKRLMSSLEKFFSERKKHHEVRAETAVREVEGQTVLKDHLEVIMRGQDSGFKAQCTGGSDSGQDAQDQSAGERLEAISQVESIGEFASRKKADGPRKEEKQESVPVPDVLPAPQIPAHEEAPDAVSRELPEDIPQPGQAGNSAFEEAFSRAYLLASKKEVTEKMLSDEEKRMVLEISGAVKIAFRAARVKARGMQVARLASLKPGMKKIKTGELTVGEVQDVEVLKGKRRLKAARIILLDESGKFPLYLAEARGKGICVGDKLVLEGAYVDEIGEGAETSLALTPRGKLILLK